MATLAMMAVWTVPAVRGALDGANLVRAGDEVTSCLSLARQTTVSRNLPVQLQIYKHDDGNGDNYRLQGVVIPAPASGQTADEWICSAKTRPGQIIMDDARAFSAIWSGAETTAATTTPCSGPESTIAPGLYEILVGPHSRALNGAPLAIAC